MKNMNQKKQTVKKSSYKMIVEIDGICQQLIHNENLFQASRFANKVKAEIDWFEKIINHQPSVGQFYENILKTLLIEFAPGKYKIGTGFVYNLAEEKHSQQLDIIIYESKNKAPVYKMGDFVIIDSTQLITVCEVKKNLKKADIKKLIHMNFLFDMGTYPTEMKGIQRINLFAFKSYVKPSVLLKTIITEIDLLLENMKIHINDDRYAFLPLEHICLPYIYMFDEGKVIKSRVVNNECNLFRLEVWIDDLGVEGICGDFLLSCLMHEEVANDGNFVGTNLRIVPRDMVRNYTNELFLVNVFSMVEVFNHFADEKDMIRDFHISTKKPYRLLLPKGLDLISFSSFHDLSKDRRAVFDSDY